MVKVDELFDTTLLHAMLEEGYVRERPHPTLPFVILNYTEKAQYDRVWNPVTTQCRGLIVDWVSGTVVARPFPKFFNYGEHNDVNLPHFAPAVVTEKMDGSLGVLYPTGDGWAVATRGSFESPQALHATELLNARYSSIIDRWLNPDFTYLVEIIYPENRIVVDYGDTDDLVLLDVIDTSTGLSCGERDYFAWPGPIVHHHSFKSWREALAVQRSNKEGFVVHFPETGLRVKIKHDEYVRLHRIITNASTKSIWEVLAAGESVESLLDGVPDEFYAWVRKTADDLAAAFTWRLREAYAEFKQVCATAGVGWSIDDPYRDGRPRIWGPLPSYARKRFAEVAKTREPHLRPLLFMILDEKPLADAIWRQLKPEYARPFADELEDAA